MPRRTIALSSTSRTLITAMCTPGRSARDGIGRLGVGGAPRARGCGRSARRGAISVGTQTDSTQPSPGADSTLRSPPASCARSRMPPTPKWRPARELVEVVGHLEALAVVGDRQHGARRRASAAAPRRGRRARGAPRSRSASRRIHSSSRARRRVQLADVLDREVELDAGLARPALRLRGAARAGAAATRRVSARRPTMISRAWRVAWRASSASRRASTAAPSGSRSIRRESASAAKPIPETVLASESCMSRASRARSASAASWRSCVGQLGLGLRLAVEQPRAPPRRPPRRAGTAPAGRGRSGTCPGPCSSSSCERPVVDADEHQARRRAAGPAVEQAAEQRGRERVVEERALDAGQQQDHGRQHELGGEVGGMAHERRADAVPVAQRHERGRPAATIERERASVRSSSPGERDAA